MATTTTADYYCYDCCYYYSTTTTDYCYDYCCYYCSTTTTPTTTTAIDYRSYDHPWTNSVQARFEVLTTSSVKMSLLWAVVPRRVINTNRRFRGAYCLHHKGDDSPASETPVSIYQTTQCYIAENSHLHTRRRKNLKPQYAKSLDRDWKRCLINMTGTPIHTLTTTM
jgi:hypothetical protein